MEREAFFRWFSQEIADKYNVPCNHIRTIRTLALHEKLDRLDIMDWADLKSKQNRKKRHGMPKKYYQGIFNFLETLPDESWDDITQKTKFDAG